MKKRGYFLSNQGLRKVELSLINNNLSQEQIGEKSGLDRTTVNKALQNKNPLSIRTIRRLFDGLSLSLDVTDYQDVSQKVRFRMGDKDDLIAAAEALENEADEAEKNGDRDKAAELRNHAARLREIAAQ